MVFCPGTLGSPAVHFRVCLIQSLLLCISCWSLFCNRYVLALYFQDLSPVVALILAGIWRGGLIIEKTSRKHWLSSHVWSDSGGCEGNWNSSSPGITFPTVEPWSPIPSPSYPLNFWLYQLLVYIFLCLYFSLLRIHLIGNSLVVLWVRICLPVQGTWVWSLVWEDYTCHGATDLQLLSPCAATSYLVP